MLVCPVEVPGHDMGCIPVSLVVHESLMQLGESSVCVHLRWDISGTEDDHGALMGR